MKQSQRKTVKTPNLVVQRTVVGVEENVHAAALERVEQLQSQSNTLQGHLLDAADTINDQQDRIKVLHTRIAEARAFRFVKAVIAWGVGFALGTVACHLYGSVM